MPGYILSENRRVVVIATLESENEKTGDMVQVWIIRPDMHPVEAVATGADKAICGDCRLRGVACYVNVGFGPAAVWRAYKRGSYPVLSDYSVFAGRAIRLGAYGDPAFVPRRVIHKLAAFAHTGYTHQWRRAEWLREFVMASVDSVTEMLEARAAGWRTFRVSSANLAERGEILCPASEEAGHRTKCIDCQLCDGLRGNDQRKSIFIPVHGTRKNNFIQIGEMV